MSFEQLIYFMATEKKLLEKETPWIYMASLNLAMSSEWVSGGIIKTDINVSSPEPGYHHPSDWSLRALNEQLQINKMFH